MKTMPIRKWMLTGLICFVVLPFFTYVAVHLLDDGAIAPWQSPAGQQQAAVLSELSRVSQDYASWANPDWQSNIKTQLRNQGMRMTIMNPSGFPIFTTGSTAHGWMSSHQAIVMNEGSVVGTVELFLPMSHDGLASAAAFAVLVLTLLLVAWQIRRYVVKPLESMSQAARQIAGGDLNVEVPTSRVREVAEVRSAFHAMADGLRDSIHRQARLEDERRFFIGAIAHDLRTPLFALRGYLEGLEQGLANSPEKMAHYVEVCRQKSEQLHRLVSDLFAFTKMEYWEQTFRREKVEFTHVVQRSVDSIQPLANGKGITVSVKQKELCSVEGDAHMLERALENLLDNAVHHSPMNGRIDVVTFVEPGRILFSVADSGPGIRGEDIPNLFSPLYRGESSRNRETGGTGLGLTITRRIIRAHGGDITVANGPTGGAVFTGWIPFG